MARSRRAIANTNRRPVYQVGAATPRGARVGSLRRGTIPVWAWGCGFLAGISCIGACIIFAVAVPIGFRLLDPSQQNAIARRLPIMDIFREPTRAVAALPTVDAALAATQSAGLLNAPTLVPGAPTIVGRASTPTATFAPTATSEPLSVSFSVPNFKWEPQRWNNCGPANLVQALHILGVNLTQSEVANWLKPNKNDGNVSPWQIVTYTNTLTNVKALVRVNGDLILLKRLMAAGYGVMIETGLYSPDDGQWEGHYLTPVGWDDSRQIINGLDTLQNLPQGIDEKYDDLDRRWGHFNRVYIVLYRPDQETKLRQILGTSWDVTLNAQEALAKAQLEAQVNTNSPFAWFNMGTNFVALGQYDKAAAAYDRATSAGDGLPWRMLWYQFGPYKAYFETGQYQKVVDLATITLKNTAFIEETMYYRGLALAALGRMADAQADLQSVMSFNQNFAPAQEALAQLQNGISARPKVL